jgi:multidrug efflux system membrane fusion protein
LLVETKKNVVLVPQAAIQHGNQGDFVYLVDTDNNTVSMKSVTKGTVPIDGGPAEITSGLSEGDVVVTDGVDKLQDGGKVILTKPGAPAGENSSTTAPSATPPAGIGSGG